MKKHLKKIIKIIDEYYPFALIGLLVLVKAIDKAMGTADVYDTAFLIVFSVLLIALITLKIIGSSPRFIYRTSAAICVNGNMYMILDEPLYNSIMASPDASKYLKDYGLPYIIK